MLRPHAPKPKLSSATVERQQCNSIHKQLRSSMAADQAPLALQADDFQIIATDAPGALL